MNPKNSHTNSHDERLRYSRRLSFVPRWVAVPTIRRQSVAEHAFGVAQTVIWLAPRNARLVTPLDLLVVLELALQHDNEEAKTGDRPSPNKPRATPAPEDQVRVMIKVADILEAIAFIHEECLLGNRYSMASIMDDLRARLHDWWVAFDWKPEHGRKPLTGDLIAAYLEQVTPKMHPVMEPNT